MSRAAKKALRLPLSRNPIRWVEVGSTTFDRVAWWQDRRTSTFLALRFRESGITRCYLGVPQEMYRELLLSDSLAGYHRARLENVFPWVRAM